MYTQLLPTRPYNNCLALVMLISTRCHHWKRSSKGHYAEDFEEEHCRTKCFQRGHVPLVPPLHQYHYIAVCQLKWNWNTNCLPCKRICWKFLVQKQGYYHCSSGGHSHVTVMPYYCNVNMNITKNYIHHVCKSISSRFLVQKGIIIALLGGHSHGTVMIIPYYCNMNITKRPY